MEGHVSKVCILTAFGNAEKSMKTIWKCREKYENSVSKAYFLMLFETIWKGREKYENIVSKACILMVFETIWNCRETTENNVSNGCILTLIFETAEIVLKTMSLNHAFWCYLKRFGTAEE